MLDTAICYLCDVSKERFKKGGLKV